MPKASTGISSAFIMIKYVNMCKVEDKNHKHSSSPIR